MGTARRDNKLPWLEGGGYLLVNYTKLVIYASFACQLHFNYIFTSLRVINSQLHVKYTISYFTRKLRIITRKPRALGTTR